MTRQFLTIGQVIHIHDELVREFGGAFGVRDEGALASAVARPRMGYYDSLAAEAAALMESLCNNHPFVDGNKRTATAATEIFLNLNGFFIDCDDFAAYEFFMQLFDEGTVRFVNLLPWLEEHISPLPRRFL